MWSQAVPLTPPYGSLAFGTAVGISSDGSTAIVGDNNTNWAGIYTKTASGWSQAVPLTTPDDAVYFGYAVGISSDGSTAIVGDTNILWAGIYTKTFKLIL